MMVEQLLASLWNCWFAYLCMFVSDRDFVATFFMAFCYFLDCYLELSELLVSMQVFFLAEHYFSYSLRLLDLSQ